MCRLTAVPLTASTTIHNQLPAGITGLSKLIQLSPVVVLVTVIGSVVAAVPAALAAAPAGPRR